MSEILYQGHASVRITTDDGTVIYIDPYAGENYEKPADLILITHQHFDHTATDKPAKKAGCQIIENDEMLVNGNYQSKDIGSVHIQATEAYNRNHPKNECVGYLLEFDGKKVYIAGDTALTEQMPELANLNIDYAFLPTDGIFTMNPKEAAECAKVIGAKHVIPYHMEPGGIYSQKVADKFNAPNKLVLKPGESIDV